jgi:hypothetical protein
MPKIPQWADSAVVGVVLGFILSYIIIVQPDYIISVEPITTSVYAGTPVKTNIYVENFYDPIFHKYKYQIILCPLVLEAPVPPPESPPKLKIDFQGPEGANGAPFRTAIWINTSSDARAGRYIIKLLGFGGDGKERSCSYILDVVPRPHLA